jgi:hypothetical protein
MKLIHALALSAGLAGAALFASPTLADTTTNQTASLRNLGADAKTFYSEADVGVARRAFRAKCATTEDAGVCDCLASGYSQSLTPPKALMKSKAMNAFTTPEAQEAARAHVEEAAAQYEPLCHQPAPS